MSAPEQIDADDRDDVIARVNAVAWDEGRKCEHCDGDGKVPGGRRLVHSRLGFIGADWDAESIVALVRDARRVVWGDGGGHDLAVQRPDGEWLKFDVPHPARETDKAVTS